MIADLLGQLWMGVPTDDYNVPHHVDCPMVDPLDDFLFEKDCEVPRRSSSAMTLQSVLSDGLVLRSGM